MDSSNVADRGGSEADHTGIIYKYTDQNGAEKILSTRTLRFARPSEMNDPFDVYIEDLLGMDLEEVHERNIDVLFDRLLTDPRYFERLDLRNLENTLRIIRNASDDERIRLKQALKSIDLTALDPEYKALRDQQPALRDRFAHYLRNCGIFCATRTFSNLLMWAHYSDQHKGAVLGFVPDLVRDSMLAKIRSVTYSDQRPYLLDENDWLAPFTMETASKVNRRLYLTKSVEWSYEQELRLVIPADVKPGDAATFNSYYANELTEIYLGCRMREDARTEIIRIAKNLNPIVRIFVASLAKRKYALEFTRVA